MPPLAPILTHLTQNVRPHSGVIASTYATDPIQTTTPPTYSTEGGCPPSAPLATPPPGCWYVAAGPCGQQLVCGPQLPKPDAAPVPVGLSLQGKLLLGGFIVLLAGGLAYVATR